MATVQHVAASSDGAEVWYNYDSVSMAMIAIGVTGVTRPTRVRYTDKSGIARTVLITTDQTVNITSARRPLLSTVAERNGRLSGADIWVGWE